MNSIYGFYCKFAALDFSATRGNGRVEQIRFLFISSLGRGGGGGVNCSLHFLSRLHTDITVEKASRKLWVLNTYLIANQFYQKIR